MIQGDSEGAELRGAVNIEGLRLRGKTDGAITVQHDIATRIASMALGLGKVSAGAANRAICPL